MLTSMVRHAGVVIGCVVGALSAAQAGPTKESRAEGKAYAILEVTRRLPRLDQGDASRMLSGDWHPRPRPADDPVLLEPRGRRQIIDATCDADLVVIGHATSAAPFEHARRRWLLTAHDLEVTQVLRAKDPTRRDTTRIRYVHPSGRLAIAGRTVTTVIDRFPLLTDEEALFFLVAIGKSEAYRASLDVPVLAIRGGALYAQVRPEAETERVAFEGMSARDAVRAVGGAVCRPPPVRQRPGAPPDRAPFYPDPR